MNKLLLKLHYFYSQRFNDFVPTKYLVNKILARLEYFSDRELRVAVSYIKGDHLDIIAEDLGVTRERVRQMLWKLVIRGF